MNRSRGAGWTGVVLAGGASKRMGRDKAMIEWQGKSLLDHALDILEPATDDLLVIGDPMKYGHVGPFVIADDRPGSGPLGGLVTAMRYATNDKMLLLACDLPNVDVGLLERLKQELGNFTDAVVPRHNGLIEPMVAAYHRRCAPLFRENLELGVNKMSDALDLVRTNYIEIKPGTGMWPADIFKNLNAPGDL